MQVRLRREKVALSPVYYTALQTEAVKAGPFSGFSLASAPALKDDEARFAAGSVFGSSSGSGAGAAAPEDSGYGGYSSTARGRTPLNAQPAAAAPTAAAGGAGQQGQQTGPRWGYLRLTSFSQNAAEETKHAIQSLEVGAVPEPEPELELEPAPEEPLVPQASLCDACAPKNVSHGRQG